MNPTPAEIAQARNTLRTAGALMAICSIIGCPFMVFGGSFGLAAFFDPGIYADLVRGFDWESQTEAGAQGAVFVTMGLSRILTLAGAFCVYKQRVRPLAFVGAVFMCVPCLTTCVFMDVGVGLFALFAMLNEPSRAAFAERT